MEFGLAILTENRKIPGGIIVTRDKEVPPEVFRFLTQTKASCAGLEGADTGNSRH
jgi:hypothetical protein